MLVGAVGFLNLSRARSSTSFPAVTKVDGLPPASSSSSSSMPKSSTRPSFHQLAEECSTSHSQASSN
eukprot:3611038-Pyramimonas_sp.AAC.1